MLLVWLLIRWQRVRDDRLLLALGVVIGIAAMTKFQVMLLCLVLLVAVAIWGPRELLRRPLFWAGAALAALNAAPTLIWQHLHGWPQFRMTPVVAGEAEALYGGRPGIACSCWCSRVWPVWCSGRTDSCDCYGRTSAALPVSRDDFRGALRRVRRHRGSSLLSGRAVRRWRRRARSACNVAARRAECASVAGLAGLVGHLCRRDRHSGDVGIDRALRRRREHRASDRQMSITDYPPRNGTTVSSSVSPTSWPRSSTVIRSGTACRRIQPQPQLRILRTAARRPRRRALRRK